MLFLVEAFVVVADGESGGGFEAVGGGVSCFVVADGECEPVHESRQLLKGGQENR